MESLLKPAETLSIISESRKLVHSFQSSSGKAFKIMTLDLRHNWKERSCSKIKGGNFLEKETAIESQRKRPFFSLSLGQHNVAVERNLLLLPPLRSLCQKILLYSSPKWLTNLVVVPLGWGSYLVILYFPGKKILLGDKYESFLS